MKSLGLAADGKTAAVSPSALVGRRARNAEGEIVGALYLNDRHFDEHLERAQIDRLYNLLNERPIFLRGADDEGIARLLGHDANRVGGAGETAPAELLKDLLPEVGRTESDSGRPPPQRDGGPRRQS